MTRVGWVLLWLLLGGGSGLAATDLANSCYMQTIPAARHDPGLRVAVMRVRFQEFQGSLLAAVAYELRYGTTYGVSGDCQVEIEGGYQCEACGSGACAPLSERFKVLTAGGQVEIVNDSTGLLGSNAQGGRDYLPPRGGLRGFVLSQASPEACDG